MPVAQEERRRVQDLHLAVSADKEVVKERVRRWDPEMKAHWNATRASPPEGVDAADQCQKASGQDCGG